LGILGKDMSFNSLQQFDKEGEEKGFVCETILVTHGTLQKSTLEKDLLGDLNERFNVLRELEMRRRDFVCEIYGILAMGFGYLHTGNLGTDVVQKFCNRVLRVLEEVEKAKVILGEWRDKGMTVSLEDCIVRYDQLIEGRISELVNLWRDLCYEGAQYQTEMMSRGKYGDNTHGTAMLRPTSVLVQPLGDKYHHDKILKILTDLKKGSVVTKEGLVDDRKEVASEEVV
jgi:hypothetical protein